MIPYRVLASVWVLSVGLSPLRAIGDDLLDIYRLAVQNDPRLMASYQQLQATLQTKPAARALLLPNLAAGADVSRNRYANKGGPTDLSTDQTYSLSLSQVLYNREYWYQLAQTDSAIAQAQAAYQAAEQDLALRTAQAYFNVLTARATLAAVQADKSAIERQLEQAKQRFEVGLIAITDVLEAQARFDQAVASEIEARNNLDSAREAVAEITGQPPGPLADLGKTLPLLSPEPADSEQWVKTALDQNPDVLAAQFAVDSARQEVEIQRSGHYPTVDIVASHSHQDVSFGGVAPLTRWDSSIGVQANLPLYQGGGVVARTREAIHRQEEAKDNLVTVNRQTTAQARNSYRDVLTAISQVNAQRQAVVSAETALEATEAGFEVGTRTIVDVLNFQRELYLSRRDFATSRYDYILAILALMRSAGSLDDEDIMAVNGWLVGGPTPFVPPAGPP